MLSEAHSSMLSRRAGPDVRDERSPSGTLALTSAHCQGGTLGQMALRTHSGAAPKGIDSNANLLSSRAQATRTSVEGNSAHVSCSAGRWSALYSFTLNNTRLIAHT
jgi:hypothetical protein